MSFESNRNNEYSILSADIIISKTVEIVIAITDETIIITDTYCKLFS